MDTILDLIVIAFPTAIAILGVYVSIKLTKSEPHKLLLGVIIAVGLLGSLLTGFQQYRSREAHKNEVESQRKATEKLQMMFQETQAKNAAELGYLKGKLDTLSQLGPAEIKNLGQAIAQSNVEIAKREAQKMNNKQLSESAISFARKMREFEAAHRQKRNIIFEKYWITFMKATPEERNRRVNEETTAYSQAHMEEDIEFKNTLLGEGIYLRDELLRRLPLQQLSQEEKMQQLAFRGVLAGPSPVSDAADYLEKLARKLTPQ